jgi:hypothetical protein
LDPRFIVLGMPLEYDAFKLHVFEIVHLFRSSFSVQQRLYSLPKNGDARSSFLYKTSSDIFRDHRNLLHPSVFRRRAQSLLRNYELSGFLKSRFGRTTLRIRLPPNCIGRVSFAYFKSVFLGRLNPLLYALYIITIIQRNRATRQMDSSRISLQKGLINALARPDKTPELPRQCQ